MQDIDLRITLSAEDRELLLKHTLLSPELEATLSIGVREGIRLSFFVSRKEAEALSQCTAVAACQTKNRTLRRKLERLFDQFAETLRLHAEASAENRPAPPRALPAAMREEIEQVLASKEFASLEEFNAELKKIGAAHNTRPLAEFLGLSREQVYRLIHADWRAPSALMHCRSDLTLEEADTSELFHNARIFLSVLDAEGSIKATPAGNINRKSVLVLMAAMRRPEQFPEELWGSNAILKEEDVDPLHILRILLKLAGLIRKEKGRFRITRKGFSLLQSRNAGELYATLFLAYFTRFNLAYGDRMEECPLMQQTIPYSLYALGKTARQWRVLDELAEVVLLPAVIEELNALPNDVMHSSLLYRRIVCPLERFGMIECKYDSANRFCSLSVLGVRVPPLFDRVLEFRVDADPVQPADTDPVHPVDTGIRH